MAASLYVDRNKNFLKNFIFLRLRNALYQETDAAIIKSFNFDIFMPLTKNRSLHTFSTITNIYVDTTTSSPVSHHKNPNITFPNFHAYTKVQNETLY